MPQFAVNPVPVMISQSITDAALIQNLGDVNVYLDVDSSVSIAAFSIVLGPRDSINWQANTPLWAATAIGNTSALSVLYGADGAALGSVTVIGTVSIDGDVHLDGPIEIAGPVTVEGTVTVGNIVDTNVVNNVQTTVSNVVSTEVTNNVETTVSNVVTTNVQNTVSTEVTNQVATNIVGTVDTVVSGPVDVSGSDVNVAGNVGITGPVTVAGPIDVTGTVDVDGPVDVTGTVGITGPVTVGGAVEVSGPVDVSGSDVAVSGTVGISGPVTIGGPVEISGTVPVEGDVNVSGPVTVTNTVAIDGTVDIDLPVKVQGGGELLASDVVSLSGSSPITINIPAPPSGLAYPGLLFEFAIPDSGSVNRVVQIAAQTPNTVYVTALNNPPSGTAYRSQWRPWLSRFTVPMDGEYPISLEIMHIGSDFTAVDVYYSVMGVATTPTEPTTDLTQYANNVEIMVSLPSTDRIMLPPSFQPYTVYMYVAAGASVTACTIECLSGGVWTDLMHQVHTSIYYPYPTPGTAPARTTVMLTIPPGNSTKRLRFTGAGGDLYFTFLGAP